MSVAYPGQLPSRLSGEPSGGAPAGTGGRPLRRVRHEVRDGLVVTAFSAVASSVLAVVLLLLVELVG